MQKGTLKKMKFKKNCSKSKILSTLDASKACLQINKIWHSILLPIKTGIFGVKASIGSNNGITDQLHKGIESLNDFKSRLYCSVDETSSAKRLSVEVSFLKKTTEMLSKFTKKKSAQDSFRCYIFDYLLTHYIV